MDLIFSSDAATYDPTYFYDASHTISMSTISAVNGDIENIITALVDSDVTVTLSLTVNDIEVWTHAWDAAGFDISPAVPIVIGDTVKLSATWTGATYTYVYEYLSTTKSGWTATGFSGDDSWAITFYGTLSGLDKATNPTPANGATDISKHLAQLSWECAGSYDSFDIYLDDGILGTSDLIASGVTDLFLNLTPTLLDGIGGIFIWGQQYFWRVDTVYGASTVTGTEWDFTTESITHYPQPNNGATDSEAEADPTKRNILKQIKRFIVASGNGIWIGE